MAEPEEEEDPFAGMSATSSTVRRKSEPPEADPFADFAGPRSTRRRRVLDRDDSATIQEMPGFVVGEEEPTSAGSTQGSPRFRIARTTRSSALSLRWDAGGPPRGEPLRDPRVGALKAPRDLHRTPVLRKRDARCGSGPLGLDTRLSTRFNGRDSRVYPTMASLHWARWPEAGSDTPSDFEDAAGWHGPRSTAPAKGVLS